MVDQCPPDNCPEPDPNSAEVEALFPEGQGPQVRFSNLSSICHYGLTPLVMQGAIRQVLIQHFGDARNIMNHTLRNRLEENGVWKDGDDSGIYIESLHRWRPAFTESRPGLVIKEGAWRWKRMGIGDRYGQDERSGREFYGGYWFGSHTVFALQNEGAEAQILAIEAMKCMQFFQHEIEKHLDLQHFIPVSIGEVSALKESTENYVVPIVVAYVVPDFWYIQGDYPRLKQIVFQTSVTHEWY